MDLRAIQVALAAKVTPFVFCHDQIPSNVEFPCAYVSMPTLIEVCTTLAGGHTLSMPVTLCLSRNDDLVAQTQLSTILSSGLLDALDSASAAWSDAQFTSVGNFRTVTFAGGNDPVIACDLNTVILT